MIRANCWMYKLICMILLCQNFSQTCRKGTRDLFSQQKSFSSFPMNGLEGPGSSGIPSATVGSWRFRADEIIDA
jgi:hypothetical protein